MEDADRGELWGYVTAVCGYVTTMTMTLMLIMMIDKIR